MKKLFFIIVIGYALCSTGLFSLESKKPPSLMLSIQETMGKLESYIERHRTSDVKAVFDFFIDLFSLPTTPNDCKDGKYKGESIYDDYAYKHSISIEIKDKKIIYVYYDEVKSSGSGKRGNSQYCDEMKKVTGASPAEAYPIYEERLLKNQDLMKIDALSGATYSLYRFRSAAIRALQQAKK